MPYDNCFDDSPITEAEMAAGEAVYKAQTAKEAPARARLAVWTKRRAELLAAGARQDGSLYGRWRCPHLIVEFPCTQYRVIVHDGQCYCFSCGEEAPKAARLLGL